MENQRKSMKIRREGELDRSFRSANNRKSLKIDENRRKINGKSMKITEKPVKIGHQGSSRRATGHFKLRTTRRVGAVGGGRGREVYLLN